MAPPKKALCKNGHERTPENVTANRGCRICLKLHMRVARHGDPDYITPEEVRRLNNSKAQRARKPASNNSYIKMMGRHEHRIVAEQMLGRPLTRHEIVHHVNGDKHDNRPDNLQVMTQKQHIDLHRSQGECVRKCC